MSIKNFSYRQIEQKARELREILITCQEGSVGLLEDEVSSFLRQNEFAPLLATICDEEIKTEDAWRFPYWLRNEMGKEGKGFDIESLLTQSFKKHLERYLNAKYNSWKGKQKYLESIPGYLESALRYFQREGKNPVSLFENRPYQALEIYFTLRTIPGIGPKKASMIARDFIVDSKSEGKRYGNVWFHQVKHKNPLFKVTNEELLDMPIDVHVVKVFNRLFGRRTANWRDELQAHTQDIIAFSKMVTPEFPARLDILFWNAGKNYCKDYGPQCQDCYLSKICEVCKRNRRLAEGS